MINLRKSFIALYAMLLIVYLFISMLAKHGDHISLTNWTINIWDALFSGRIREYFLVSAQTARDAPHGGSAFGILYLLPWAIWNFPLWLSRIITKSNSVGTTLCLTWSKMFLVICAHIMSVYCAKIVRFFTEDKELDVTVFLYTLGCGTMFLSIAYFGQDEIIYMVTLVMSLYYIIIDKKTLGYILLGVTCTLCNIMLVPSLAILLIKEKNLLKVGALLVCFVLPEKIVSAFCGIGQLPEIAKTYTVYPMSMKMLFDWFFSYCNVKTSDWSFSVFMVSLVIIYAYAYLFKAKDERQEKYNIILYSALSLFSMTVFSLLHSYRYFVYFPLVATCIFIKGNDHKNYKNGLLFLSVRDFCSVCVITAVGYALRFSSLSIGIIKKFCLNHGYEGDFYTLFHDILNINIFGAYHVFMSSLSIGCAVLIIIFLFKKFESFYHPVSVKLILILNTFIPIFLTVSVIILPVVCLKLKYRPCANPVVNMIEKDIGSTKYAIDVQKNSVNGWFYCGNEYEVYVKRNEKYYKLTKTLRNDVTNYLGIDDAIFTGFYGYFPESKEFDVLFVDLKENVYYKTHQKSIREDSTNDE